MEVRNGDCMCPEAATCLFKVMGALTPYILTQEVGDVCLPNWFVECGNAIWLCDLVVAFKCGRSGDCTWLSTESSLFKVIDALTTFP